MSSDNNFNVYSRYYDLLYKDKDYSKETEYVIRKLHSLLPEAKTLLELGCGTGNHAAGLCAAGFTVTGLERSSEMVELAKKKSINGFEPVVADIAYYSLDKKFDAAISLFHVISYLTRNELLLSCFNNTAAHLNEGGIFLFDIWYSPAVYHFKPETRVKRLSDDTVEITRLAEPEIHDNENIVDVNYQIISTDKKTRITDTVTEKHPMRHFSLPEIGLLASATGFKLIAAEEFMTGKPAGKETWGVCCILQKK